jgi:hypothetical protein
LKTFSFAKQDRKPPDGLATNLRAEDLIRENLELEFSAIGMEKVSAEADFLFAFYAKSVLRTRWQTPSGGGPGSSGNRAWGYEVGTLVVDIVDHKSNQVVWRGIATKTLSPNQDKANQAVREACMKLAKQFKKNGTNRPRLSKRPKGLSILMTRISCGVAPTGKHWLMRRSLSLSISGILACSMLTAQAQPMAKLKPETLEGFNRYVKTTEASLQKRRDRKMPALWLYDDPGNRARALNGEIVIERLSNNSDTPVAGGIIHDWVAMFILGPDGSRARCLQDFNRHKQIYPKPSIPS